MAADLGTGLFSWIQTVSAITSVIGAGAACQFYPVAVLEKKTPPLIVYEDQKDTTTTTHNDPSTVASSRVSFACMAVDPEHAGALAELLRVALSNFRGTMGTVVVQGVIYEGSSPSYAWDSQRFAVDATFKFWYAL